MTLERVRHHSSLHGDSAPFFRRGLAPVSWQTLKPIPILARQLDLPQAFPVKTDTEVVSEFVRKNQMNWLISIEPGGFEGVKLCEEWRDQEYSAESSVAGCASAA